MSLKSCCKSASTLTIILDLSFIASSIPDFTAAANPKFFLCTIFEHGKLRLSIILLELSVEPSLTKIK